MLDVAVRACYCLVGIRIHDVGLSPRLLRRPVVDHVGEMARRSGIIDAERGDALSLYHAMPLTLHLRVRWSVETEGDPVI